MQTKTTGFLSMRGNGLLLILMLITIPVLVSAASPVDLTVGMTGAFPWSESGIMPGSSNSTFFELHNNGTLGGTLYVWLDNISEIDPHGSGTAFGNYLYLNVSHPRLSSSMPLPAKVYSFPTAPMRAQYITISPFSPGETIKLNWTWEFRETGTPQNDAQNASLRFNISYTLVNVPPPTPSPVPTSSPAPTRSPIPIPGSDDDGGGGSVSIISKHEMPVTNQQTVLPEQSQQPGYIEPEQTPVQCIQVPQHYTIGSVGMLYNADNETTLDLNIPQAQAGGANVTTYPDYIDVYQNDTPGVLYRFRVDTSDIRNTTRIVKTVNSAELWTDPLTANLTTGPYTGSIHTIPTRILAPSVIKITLSDCIGPEITSDIRNISAQNNLALGNIAYMMTVERTNLPDLGEANVTMTLPASWVDQQGGTDSVHVARISEETGNKELLNTVFVGSDANGNMIFRGDSPNGTSRFVLFSAGQTAPQQQEPYPAAIGIFQIPATIIQFIRSGWYLHPVLIGLILLIIILAVIAVYFGWWREKKS